MAAAPGGAVPLINDNPKLQSYYQSLESRVGYRLVLGGTRHFGYWYVSLLLLICPIKMHITPIMGWYWREGSGLLLGTMGGFRLVMMVMV